MAGLLLSINTSDGGVPKRPRHEAFVAESGITGDRQRDRRHHGGPERAVCLYAYELIRQLQQEGHDVSVGLLGENLTVLGLDWRTLTPGTGVDVGGVRLRLTSFAVPCRNLASSFDGARVDRISQKQNPGWSRVYARVERPGPVHLGDPVRLADDTEASPAVTTRRLVRREGRIRLPAPVATTFPLFTPDGERLWVPGFDPAFLHPASGEQGPGAIFTTNHDGEDTLWMVLRLSPADGIAEYARVTPGSRRGVVRVRLEPEDGATAATIAYELESLSEAGDTALDALTDAAYRSMLQDWEARVTAVVTNDAFE
jgi:MOSC domain-containing protein YiiM